MQQSSYIGSGFSALCLGHVQKACSMSTAPLQLQIQIALLLGTCTLYAMLTDDVSLYKK